MKLHTLSNLEHHRSNQDETLIEHLFGVLHVNNLVSRAHLGGLSNKSLVSLLLIIVLFTLVALPAHSQTTADKKLNAVLTVINLFLLDALVPPIPQPSGSGFRIGVDGSAGGPFDPPSNVDVSENLYAEFDLHEQTVEYCVFIDSSELIEPGDLTIEVNGEPQAAHFGENCIVVPRHQQRRVNYINLIVNRESFIVTLSQIELQSTQQSQLLLPRLTRGEWDERAVRKVLKIFAFGGHSTDAQIVTWAAMKPADAILEMLNFDEHNLLLSPLAPGEQYSESASLNGKLWDWQEFMADTNSNMPIPAGNRSQYGLDGYNFDDAYNRMITVRGMNPFRQRIGFWETNYHLAVNRDASVSRREVAAYYDLIMEAHEAGLPYYQVMAIAAKSAAIAEQYGHDRNQWRYDRDLDEYYCACNDDFAREIHQLFFGIFGADDPDHHETVTIPNTARMLTDMPINSDDDIFSDVRVNFGTERHYNSNGGEPLLSILNYDIPHSTTAAEKIDFLMPLSMQHPESLINLPIMIIEGLADNNLSDAKKSRLRASWASLGAERVLLDFIQAYAISELFHSPSQLRYLTSHERALYLANKNNLENFEAYYGGGSYGGRAGRTVGSVISEDNAGEFFRPIHNVFGGQSPLEAADSALAFENNFNRLTERDYEMRDNVHCHDCNQGADWEKLWGQVLPRRADGNFYVADVAQWLWNHAVGSLDNYTELERAQLYALLGAARSSPGQQHDQNVTMDFTLLMCVIEDYQRNDDNADISLQNILGSNVMFTYCDDDDDGVEGYTVEEQAALNRVHTGVQIAEDPVIQTLLTELGNQTLPLLSEGETYSHELRERALRRVNNALGFIFNTPFVFAEGQ